MGDLYSIHPGISRVGVDMRSFQFQESSSAAYASEGASEICDSVAGGGPVLTDLIKSQIAGHPRYPSLLAAYIGCRKVGAPPEIATLLEEMAREKHYASAGRGEIGADPELDEFMESYCRVLVQYKEELSKPFDEVSSFLTSIETQLRNLCSEGGTAVAASTTTTQYSPSEK